MMKTDLQHGRVRYWALIFSVAAHSVTLAVFAGVKLSGRDQSELKQQPALELQMVERIAAQTAPKPKPRVEPIVEPVVEPVVAAVADPPPLIADVTEPVTASPPPSDPLPIVEPVEPDAPDEVEFFGQKSVVCRVCYVVDCSGSMYGRMYLVKDQLKKSILNLNSRQTFSVMFFKEGREILSSAGNTLTSASAVEKSAALELIESVRPLGTTDAGYALERAMQLRDSAGQGPEVVFFLTDGFDLDSENSRLFAEKIERLRQLHAPGAVLYTIGFDTQIQDRQMLRQMAKNTGGAFVGIN